MVYLFHLLDMGQTMKRFICYSTGDETGEFRSRGTGGKGNIYKQYTFFPRSVGEHGVSARVGGWVQQQVGTRRLGEEGLWAPQEM